MILLTLLAVGLLTLSSVALRASSQGNAMALAKSNARLAMMLALGELQKTAGTDRAITAAASVRQEKYPSGLTGVWRARDVNEEGLSREEVDKKFVGWLVSNPDRRLVLDPQRPPFLSADTSGAALLLGNGSLGLRKDRKQDDQRIALQPSAVHTLSQVGGLAWAVIDENVKSRIDLYHNPKNQQTFTNIARAGAPPIDGMTLLGGWEGFRLDAANAGKLPTLGTVPLTGLVTQENTAIYDPDVTVFSNSLMTDPVNGGLKHDLSMLSSRPLNSTENSARLYKFTGVITDNQPSDPFLSRLTSYHQLPARLGVREGLLRPSAMQVAAKLPPRGYTPYDIDPANPSGLRINKVAPNDTLLVPSVVRVDVIFSMITRMAHGTWASQYGANRYLLHMQYLPVVTLYNPYSVPMVFEGMKVTFKNLPVGFNFMVDGQPVSTRLVALNQMYVAFENSDTASKDFGISLKPGIGSTGGTTLTLEPGQTKLFGMPKVSPSWTWLQESPGVGVDGVHLFDFRNDKTANFDMAPTMMTTSNASAAGFDIDWINPTVLQTAKGAEVSEGNGRGMVRLIGSERLGVQFGPYAPPAGKGVFSVAIDLIRNDVPVKAGAFNVRYGDQARLNDLLAKGTSVRYPKPRRFPATYPKPGEDPPISTGTIFEDGNRPLRDYVKAKPFMIFSLAAKTTLESFLPSKTLVAGNPTCNIADIDLTRGKDPEGGVPVEMVMMPISPATPAIEENRPAQEGYFFSGNGATYGTSRATLYEFPVIPLESLAQFRHANLATSGFMPFTTYTAGESFAHPQIGTTVSRERWSDRNVMLDHAYLANRALWDQFFLSTVADRTGSFFGGSAGAVTKPSSKVLTEFFEEGQPLLNARFKPYNRSKATPTALTQTAAGNPAYQQLAAYLILNGGFNVNSTSVDAWATVLASLQDAEIETVLGPEGPGSDRFALLRVRRPAEKAIDGAPIALRQNRWQGYRRLSRPQVKMLAEQIVKQIRMRGPFLSLADFVNRAIGPEGPTTTMGTIQAAIEATDINNLTKIDGKDLLMADVAGPSYGYKSDMAAVGNTATAAPGMLTQGDVLSVIGSRITARGDTFRIRSYGEARDLSGRQVLARAWCEAVVQRVPDFVDAGNEAFIAFTELNTVNKRFGRRYEIIGFRWLNPSEV